MKKFCAWCEVEIVGQPVETDNQTYCSSECASEGDSERVPLRNVEDDVRRETREQHLAGQDTV